MRCFVGAVQDKPDYCWLGEVLTSSRSTRGISVSALTLRSVVSVVTTLRTKKMEFLSLVGEFMTKL